MNSTTGLRRLSWTLALLAGAALEMGCLGETATDDEDVAASEQALRATEFNGIEGPRPSRARDLPPGSLKAGPVPDPWSKQAGRVPCVTGFSPCLEGAR